MKVLTLIILTLWSSVTLSDTLNVRFRSRVYEGLKNVELGDILSIHSRNRSLAAKLEALPIDLASFSQPLSQKIVEKHLRQQAQTETKIRWSGAKTLTVAIKEDFTQRITEQAKSKLASWLGQYYTNFKLKSLNTSSLLFTKNSQVEIEPIASSQVKKRMALTAKVSEREETTKTITLWFAVSVEAEVLRAQREIRSGEELNLNDFSVAKTQLKDLKANYIETNKFSNKLFALTDINKGEILTKTMLSDKAIIPANKTVKLILKKGAISLSTTALTLEQGTLGETIEVMPEKSAQSLLATIIGEGEVQID